MELPPFSRRSVRSRAAVFVVAAIVSLCGRTPSAHDSLSDQIARVTAQLLGNPTSTELIVQRADLYRADGQWKQALADLDRAAKLDPAMAAPDLVRAHVFLDSHQWSRAIDAASRFLSRQPAHPDALAVRARAHAHLGRGNDAAADFTRALAQRPLPDVYIERARATTGVGGAGVEEALRGLDDGIARLGPVVTLELEAINLELQLKRHDAALARLDRVAAQAARKESWLARRGAILEQAGRNDQALIAYRAALDAAVSQSERVQQTRATQALIQQLRLDIKRLRLKPDATTASTGRLKPERHDDNSAVRLKPDATTDIE